MKEYQLGLFDENPLPCPFCGKHPDIKFDILTGIVRTQCCDMTVSSIIRGTSDDKAFIRKWNNRV